MGRIHINTRQVEFAKAENCKFTACQVLTLMVLFPFFAIKNSFNFAGSVLGQMFVCKKDMFYRFLYNEDINWRQIVYNFNRRLLGKCQCRDFASQIASISLCMLQYNILGYVKRYESYETISGVFREVTKASVELTVTEKIWGILVEVLQTIAEAFNFDQDEMMRAIINNNNKKP